VRSAGVEGDGVGGVSCPACRAEGEVERHGS
jgi:hypothetical protein